MSALARAAIAVLDVVEGQDALALVGCGASWAACAWILLGWRASEVAAAAKKAADRLRQEALLLAKALENMGRGLGRHFGFAKAPHRATTLNEVSEMIDIVRLGLLAGLSFDAALELYCEDRGGALAERLARARFSWQTGLETRSEALLKAARDLDVRALETFAMAVGQALELGAPLSETLLSQSKEIRAAHRADVERQIEKAPVKLLIPTGTLILPALLLSILGPLLAAGGMI